jgi:antitoxin component YwqK of YwqJK toxin-antitoxin module
MNRRRYILFVVLVLVGLCLYFIFRPETLPIADLSSPSQEVRDAAAKVLREKAKPTQKIKWFLFTSRLKKDETGTKLFDLFKSYNVKPEPEVLLGGLGVYAEFRLDYYWLLGCSFDDRNQTNSILVSWKLIPRWSAVEVKPSTNFSGVWTTYFANGQKFSERNYTNGLLSGEFKSYSSDGSKSSIFYYDRGRPNGLWTHYYPSGQIKFQQQFSNAVQVGDIVRYYENGSKRAIGHYVDGKLNGLSVDYFPSGKVKYQCLYSNNTSIGLEIKYNEDGTTNSVRDHSKP